MLRMQRQLVDFHNAMSQPVGETPEIRTPELRVKLISEESTELIGAIQRGDLVEAIDGICDVLYVTIGTAVAFGIDIGPFFEEVHRTNMLKTTGPVREDGKRLKPEGWLPPRIAELLADQRVVPISNDPLLDLWAEVGATCDTDDADGIAKAAMVYIDASKIKLQGRPYHVVRPPANSLLAGALRLACDQLSSTEQFYGDSMVGSDRAVLISTLSKCRDVLRGDSQHGVVPEPPPTSGGGRPIADLVIDDMAARRDYGLLKYRTYLKAGDDRRSLTDLYQELLDACVYAKKAIIEQEVRDAEVRPQGAG